MIEQLHSNQGGQATLEKPKVQRRITFLFKGLERYYEKSIKISKDFGGPSIYFHRECIKECDNDKAFLSCRHIELIYATLTSWGMHRMGKTKTKLVGFCKFSKSIKDQEEKLRHLRKYDLTTICKNQLEKIIKNEIRGIFFNLTVSESDSKFVAHTKTIHHLLPKLVPPMDRKHTMKLFYDTENVPKSKEKQYERFTTIMKEIHSLAKKMVRRKKFSKLRELRKDRAFNTSYTKIIDNLIISWVKSHPQKSSSHH